MSTRVSRLVVVLVLVLSPTIVQAEPRRDADGVTLPDGALKDIASTNAVTTASASQPAVAQQKVNLLA